MKLKFPVTGKKGSYYSCCVGGTPCAALLDYLNNLDGGTVELTGWYLLLGPDCSGCDALNGTHSMSLRGAYVCHAPNLCGDPSATFSGPGYTVCLTLTGTQCGGTSWGGDFYGCLPFTLFFSCNPELGSFSLGVVMPNNASPIFEQTFAAPADPSHPAGTYVLEPTGASTTVAACAIGQQGHDPGTCVVTLP